MTNRTGRIARQAAKLEAALSGLDTMDVDALRTRWHALTGRTAPTTFRMPLLRAAVAYKLQERVQGGLKASTRHLLRRVSDAADPVGRDRSTGSTGPGLTTPGSVAPTATPSSPAIAPRRPPAPPLRIKPGTRLLRTWQGGTHEVLVGDKGVSYRGQQYRSLSEVARLITGQRWSGPLFFGLKRRAAPGAELAATGRATAGRGSRP